MLLRQGTYPLLLLEKRHFWSKHREEYHMLSVYEQAQFAALSLEGSDWLSTPPQYTSFGNQESQNCRHGDRYRVRTSSFCIKLEAVMVVDRNMHA